MGSKKRKSRDDRDTSSSGSDEPSTSTSSSSEDEQSRKLKRERRKDKDRKEKKEKKTKKEKDKKKHKKHKDRDKDRDKQEELLQAAQEFLKKTLAGGSNAGAGAAGAGAGGAGPLSGLAAVLPESQRISDDDYFRKGNEFMAWLHEERGLLFNELSTEETHRLFEGFVSLWNAGRLAQKFYAGTVAAPIKRTTHKWAFAGGSGSGTGARGMAAYLDDQKSKQGDARDAERTAARRRRADEKEVLEELLPRATGRDAVVEKRVARREEAKARESSPDRAFLPGGGDMMGGDDSFAAAKAREARRHEAQRNRAVVKQEELALKAAQFQAKDDEKMAAFRALLNKGPITIARREPTS
eukprot:CAMPEP_0202905990 /NCGR_PEP_ID=MMETSP1392-20130828/36933_1 /ASSEMBLY_ACC=CAM_ASM_000868 /TAXON_ID=225041 /ORGANISM="Chlamydomonas chlamydogama, Strain SAG 11-48b" /LENGTH=353 /DNA_ID=CAMNT_0049594321 /DNA_START=32 /DNA_END=1093 /DNA_ORIENTATION=-